MKAMGKIRTIDEYLALLSDDKRVALERLRKIIRVAAPKAEECISYQIPAFRLKARAMPRARSAPIIRCFRNCSTRH
jgi:uncharacterized protein YdhG (YjbR/CyaY superfamily)